MKRRLLLCSIIVLATFSTTGQSWQDMKIRHWIAQAKEREGCVRYALILKPNSSEFVPIEDVLQRLAKQSARQRSMEILYWSRLASWNGNRSSIQ